MNANTGGPAFPIPIISQNQSTGETSIWQTEGGMTLRDYFAAKALSGFIASHSGPDVTTPEPERAASRAYEYADAMLKERDK